jgi:hypothetical protein
MILEILALFVEFVVQSVFLTLALWIMIKVQKLDYNFFGLMGSAALACAVDSILTLALQPWFDGMATYISAPFFLVVLFLCVRKVTNADPVDVSFTIVVGGALRFGMNLWLIGALMGDLRPSAGNSGDADVDLQPPETNEVQQIATRTNQPVQRKAGLYHLARRIGLDPNVERPGLRAFQGAGRRLGGAGHQRNRNEIAVSLKRTQLTFGLVAALATVSIEVTAADTNIAPTFSNLMFTTEAYKREALQLVLQEANQVAQQLRLPEEMPITESNLAGAFIAP